MDTITYSNADSNQFWLQLMGDNALLIYNALTPSGIKAAQQVAMFIKRFDHLLQRARQQLTPAQTSDLNREVFQVVQEFHAFLLEILRQQLTKGYPISLKPAMVSNMLSFAEEYARQIEHFIQYRNPPYEPEEWSIFWLPAFITQAKYIADNMGYYEYDAKQRAEGYANSFTQLLIESIELKNELRIGTEDFPVAIEHRKKEEKVFRSYAEFLVEMISLIRHNRMPGTLPLSYLDLSYRMLCYYLTELSAYEKTEKPACDPTAPRISTT